MLILSFVKKITRVANHKNNKHGVIANDMMQSQKPQIAAQGIASVPSQ